MTVFDTVFYLEEQLDAAEERIRKLEGLIAFDRRIGQVEQRLTVGALRVSHHAVQQVIDWIGASHEEDCPGDDTCDCKFKPLNDALNCAYRVGNAAVSYWDGPAKGKYETP